MSCSVKILKDSITKQGCRLTTIEARYGRPFHSELLTHKALSRNSASSRAIPALKLVDLIDKDPFIPVHWGKNEPGMQAFSEVENKQECLDWWLEGKRLMIEHAKKGHALGLHKQIVNRVIEPWMYITVIITATDWANLFALRDHPDAEPNFQELARTIKFELNNSTPELLLPGDWHLPLIDLDDPLDAELSLADMIKVSVGRCARVSYLTHDGKRDTQKDIALHDDLLIQQPMHSSPGEHIAIAMDDTNYYGNLRGWKQYRKFFANENVETKLGIVRY